MCGKTKVSIAGAMKSNVIGAVALVLFIVAFLVVL